MSATGPTTLEHPSDPHELIGTNWFELDPAGLGGVGVAVGELARAATTAEQQTYTATNKYRELLQEGFDRPTEAGYELGKMAGTLAKDFLTPGATGIEVTAQAILEAKLNTISAVKGAEALIWAAEFEIGLLTPVAAGGGPHASQAQIKIDALRRKIEAIKDTARTAIAGIYEDVPEPVLPAAPGLKPIIHTGPPPATAGANGSVKPLSWGEKDSTGDGGATALDNETRGEKRTSSTNERSDSATRGSSNEGDGTTRGEKRAFNESGSEELQQLAQAEGRPANPTIVPPVSPPSSGTTGSGGLSGVSGGAMPKLSTPGAGGLSGSGVPSTALPSGGLSSGGVGAAGSPVAPAAPSPAQQFLSGAAQGFSSQSPLATGASAAAAAQPFKPPPGSTMPAGPPPPVSSAVSSPGQAAQVQAPVSASPASSPPAAGAPPANAVPLAPPPAAGVPPPSAASPLPGAPAAPAPPPVAPPPPPPVLGLGKLSSAVKTANHVTHGEGLRPSLEFNTAVTLVAALHDPAIAALSGGEVGEWACAVFKRADEPARFVVASREGLSWTPPGVYMPAGVTVAALDPAVRYGTRKLWRGLRPPARVLAEYAKAIGEQPRIVVARHWSGLDALFPKPTVVAADDQVTVSPPNLVLDPACRHRLEVASPTYFWTQVCAIPESDIAAQIRVVAEGVVEAHDTAVTPAVLAELSRVLGGAPTVPPDLRSRVLAQIGQPGGEAVWQAVWDQMMAWRLAIMTAPVTAPNVLAAGEESAPWNTALVVADQVLRGWETLWLAQRPASREVLADMTYAAIGALNA